MLMPQKMLLMFFFSLLFFRIGSFPRSSLAAIIISCSQILMSKHSNLFAYITSDSIWSVLDMHVTTVSGFVFIWLEKISTSRYLKARFFFFLFYFFFPLSLSRLTHSIHRAPSHRPIEPRTQTTWSRATTAMQCR